MPTPGDTSSLTAVRRGMFSRLLNLKWPGSCAVCRSWSREALCDPCTSFFNPERPRCQRCAESLPADDDSAHPGTCARCIREEPLFDRTVVAFDYAFPWDDLIQQLKFAGRTELAGPLGDALAARIGRLAVSVDLVVPLPLSPGRLAERGYNQAQLLAKQVAGRLDLRLRSDLLLRPVEAARQAELSRERRVNNLKGVFMADPAKRSVLAGRRVALVDDVITTGSTVTQATRELLRAGARAVDVWAVARTERH